MKTLNAIAVIAFRDFIKLIRDRSRLIATFIFPFVFIGVLGKSLEQNVGQNLGYNFLLFTFTGVLAQTLFQSTASGIISLIEDRENDFSQELFVSPVSRYTIIIGKIIGETLVSFTQVIGIIAFAIIIGIPLDAWGLLRLLPVGLLVSFFGGAFGLFIIANLNSQRSANQIFPFIIFPQFFLAGIFSPIHHLPFYLLVLSRIAPLTYAVDLIRGIYYLGSPEAAEVVLFPLPVSLGISVLFATVFIVFGTWFFVKNERNK